MNENLIGKEVVDAAVKVHRELGPGLLERCMRWCCPGNWRDEDYG